MVARRPLFGSNICVPSARGVAELSHMTAAATSAPPPGKPAATGPESGDPLPHQIANRREPAEESFT